MVLVDIGSATDINAVAARFWARVDRAGPQVIETVCWLWTGAKREGGYGNIYVKGRAWQTHRLAYLLHHGTIHDNLEVCHRCDNPSCVRPDHLYQATHTKNIRDAAGKGRMGKAKGQDIARAVLTEEAIIDIRATYNQHRPGRYVKRGILSMLAAKYGVSVSTVMKVARRETWKHVT